MALSGSGGGSSREILAGKAAVLLYVKNDLAKGLNKAAADMKAFGSRIARVGAAFVGVGASAGAGLAALSGALNDLTKQGQVADALGLTAEQFSGIAGVAKSAGEDTREFVESLVTLGKLGTDAANGTEQASQAFAGMGLNAEKFVKLRADEQFFGVFEALNKVQDPLQRTRLLMQAFGEDGGKYLLPLLGKSGDELRQLAKGFEVSSKDMKAATAAGLAYAQAGAQIGKAWGAVAVSVAPLVAGIADGVAAGAARLTDFVRANRETVLGLALAAGGVAVVGVGLVGLGGAIIAVGKLWTVFAGVFSAGSAIISAAETAIAAPIVLIPAALVAAGAAFLAFTSQGQAALKGFGQQISAAFGATFQNLKFGWTEVVGAVGRGDFTGAFKAGFAAINVEWVKICNEMERQWEGSVGAMTKVFRAFHKIVVPPVNKGPGAAGGGGGPDKRGLIIPALGVTLAGLNRYIFGADKVDRQVAGAKKFDAALQGLGQDVADIANKGNDEAERKRQEELKKAQARQMQVWLESLIGRGTGWLGATGKMAAGGWEELQRLVAPVVGGDVMNKIEGLRSVTGNFAGAGVFGGSDGVQTMNRNLGDKLEKVADQCKAIADAAKQQVEGQKVMNARLLDGFLWGG